MINRREFIKRSILGATISSTGLGALLASGSVRAAPVIPRTLVNVMLEGGADLRFLFMPTPDSNPEYLTKFWDARKQLYTQNYVDYATMYNAEYITVNDGLSGAAFGIHKTSGWLIEEFNNGKVAIVANVFGSKNRRHDHSQLIVETGDPDTGRLDLQRDGWGGRLIDYISGDAKVLSVGKHVAIFANGTDANNRLLRTFHANNFRDVSLPTVDASIAERESSNVLVRALSGYYRDRGVEVEQEQLSNWPYHQFFQHYRTLKTYGEQIDTRFESVPMPLELESMSLNNSGFALQCRNLYDSCFLFDLLGTRVISMKYSGWDHHASMQDKIEANLSDVFGVSGGLATTVAQLDNDFPGTTDNLVFAFNSDFGRQLIANGSRGTDHGTGSYSIVYGSAVKGGVYGDMFPIEEAQPDASDSLGRSLLEIPGSDIKGKTSVRRVMAGVCDWVAAGSGEFVFPDYALSDIEAGVNLDELI